VRVGLMSEGAAVLLRRDAARTGRVPWHRSRRAPTRHRRRQPGDVAEGARLTTPEIGDKLTCAGTPEEIVERLQEAVVPSGINHVMFGLTDPYLVEKWSGHRIQNVPDLRGQFRLIHDRIMPVFA
jgi:alkanesulfonate monooxygenase SsuD/methylene tetrahydromethanopterin reductase-like flavin-dependent oxidoreductase (luciferase family)